MRIKKLVVSALVLSGLCVFNVRAEDTVAGNKPGSGLYPNDFGPIEIDVSGYPKEMKQNYRLFAFKCAACHTIARPINSQYLELSAEEQAAAKTREPEIFKNAKIWHIEDHIWSRYVKRMMAKPGCPVQGEDGKKIWQFLAYDSRIRKTGAQRQAWKAHRKKLVDDFRTNYHETYEKIFLEDNDKEEESHEKH